MYLSNVLVYASYYTYCILYMFDSLIDKESELIELYQSLADLTPTQPEQSSIPQGIEKIQPEEQCKYNIVCNHMQI